MIKLILSDCDNTVWDRKEGVIFPVAKERLCALPKHVKVGFCTNQTSVGLRYAMKVGGWGDPAKLKGERAIRSMYQKLVREELGLSASIYYAFAWRSSKGVYGPVESETPEWDFDAVKPGPGMLHRAMRDFKVEPDECVYIGDDTDEDEPDSGAARAAGVRFYRAPDIWQDESFWKGFKYTQEAMLAAPTKKEADVSAFMEGRKLSFAEVMTNLERIANHQVLPDKLPTYGGREGAQRAAAAAIAANLSRVVTKEGRPKKGRRRK